MAAIVWDFSDILGGGGAFDKLGFESRLLGLCTSWDFGTFAGYYGFAAEEISFGNCT